MDSGSGVLARLTLEAKADGQSLLRFGNRDINEDGVQDRGTLLKDANADVIGDDTGDDFFDGERQDAMVAVGEGPMGRRPRRRGFRRWRFVGSDDCRRGGGVLAIAVVALGAVLLLRRRSSGASADY